MVKAFLLLMVAAPLILWALVPKEFPSRIEKIPESNFKIDNEFYDTEEFSSQWYEPQGWAVGLHALNPTRANYFFNIIKKQIDVVLADAAIQEKTLEWISIGCGGGILENALLAKIDEYLSQKQAEAVSKLVRFKLTGFDISPSSIAAAKKAAADKNLVNTKFVSADFQVGNAYSIPITQDHTLDGVIMSDVLDHLNDLPRFAQELKRLLKPASVEPSIPKMYLFETITRSPITYYIVKILAEMFYFIPPGTHDWRLFVKPEEVEELLSKHDMKTVEIKGARVQFGLAEHFTWSNIKKAAGEVVEAITMKADKTQTTPPVSWKQNLKNKLASFGSTIFPITLVGSTLEDLVLVSFLGYAVNQ